MQFLNFDLQATDVAGAQLRTVPESVERVIAKSQAAAAQSAMTDSAVAHAAKKIGMVSFEDVFWRAGTEGRSQSTDALNASDTGADKAENVVPKVTTFFEQAGQSKLQTDFSAQQMPGPSAGIQLLEGVEAEPISIVEVREASESEDQTSDLDGDAPDVEASIFEQATPKQESEQQVATVASNSFTVPQSFPEVASPKLSGATGDGVARSNPGDFETAIQFNGEALPEQKSSIGVSFASEAANALTLRVGDPGPRGETDGVEAIGSRITKQENRGEKRDVSTFLPVTQNGSTMIGLGPFASEDNETAKQLPLAPVGMVKDAASDTASGAREAAPNIQFETQDQTMRVEAFGKEMRKPVIGQPPDLAMPEKGGISEAADEPKTTLKAAMTTGISQLAPDAALSYVLKNGISDKPEVQAGGAPVTEAAVKSDLENELPQGLRRKDVSKPLGSEPESELASTTEPPAEQHEIERGPAEQTKSDKGSEASDPPEQITVKTSEPSPASGLAVRASEAIFANGEKPEGLEGLEELASLSGASKDQQIAREFASPTSAANRVELSHRVAMQIADAARQLPDRPVEITLSPEELGKVRLSFQMSESGAMHVVIATERPETLDLLRRNIDSLAAEFQDLGYADSGFSFESFDQGAQNEDTSSESPGFRGGDATNLSEDNTHIAAAPVRLTLSASSGMDIRL